MLIRKTVKVFKRKENSNGEITLPSMDNTHIGVVEKTTYWFLFIPVYSGEEITKVQW